MAKGPERGQGARRPGRNKEPGSGGASRPEAQGAWVLGGNQEAAGIKADLAKSAKKAEFRWGWGPGPIARSRGRVKRTKTVLKQLLDPKGSADHVNSNRCCYISGGCTEAQSRAAFSKRV